MRRINLAIFGTQIITAMSKFNNFNNDSDELDYMDLAFLNGELDKPIKGNFWDGFFKSVAIVFGIALLVIILFFALILIL